MSEVKVHIVQCLCPSRHCILGICFLPGLTAAQKDIGGTEDITLTVDNAGEFLLTFVKQLVTKKIIPSSCGICRADVRVYHCEVGRTRFTSIAEAEPHMRALEKEQQRSAQFFNAGRN